MGKHKSTVPEEQLIYFVWLRLAESAEGLQFFRHELDLPFLFQARVQRRSEGFKGQVSLGIEEIFGQLGLLFVEICGICFGFSATR